MRCENKFCIYWNENECILDDISLDVQGNCEDCIYVNIDEENLKAERQRSLKSLYNEQKVLD